MLIAPPGGEAREVAENTLALSVEQMRPIAVHQDAVLVQLIVGVAADVLALLDHQHPASDFGKLAGHHRPRKTCTHHQNHAA
jgi:hypothetical protein